MTSSSRELIPNSVANFLNLRRLPARLDVEQTAALLGHHPNHIALLVEGRFLKPLGNPVKNGVKMFAACEVLARSSDAEWLEKAARYLTRKWAEKNARYKQGPAPSAEAGPAPALGQAA
jgi:hypothetical protein